MDIEEEKELKRLVHNLTVGVGRNDISVIRKNTLHLIEYLYPTKFI